MHVRNIFAASLAVVALGACSSIVEGTTQNVTVMSDPSGAKCTLNRPEGMVGVVHPTPGSVVVSKSKHNVSVMCEKEGYQSGAGVLSSSFQAMTIGNLLFGGIVGVAIDASSGAMNKYPDSVTVLLVPESFPSAQARDAYFDREFTERTAQAETAITTIRSTCEAAEDVCEARVTAVKAALQADLADLENKRAVVRVDS